MSDIDGGTVRSAYNVLVVGTGLMGTSIALALREKDVNVLLADADPAALRLACELGAGAEWVAPAAGGTVVDLAIIAVPPKHVAVVLCQLQAAGAARAYTDLASVKSLPIAHAKRLRCDLTSFVAGHPLAGRERSGPGAARVNLFRERPWAYCPTEDSSAEAIDALLDLIEMCGADPVRTSAAEHDRAVAVVSHAPHVVAAAMAARLSATPETTMRLAGQGLRDLTRIAAGDPHLWTGILAGNASAVADVLETVAADIAAAADALRDGTGGLARLTDLLARGVAGTTRIPGRHGGADCEQVCVKVVIGDQPGQLAKLFSLAKKMGINIEDVRLEHAPGQPLGIAELSVQANGAATLVEALRKRKWKLEQVV